MAEFERLSGRSDWIDLEFIERERTLEGIIEVGIQLHLAGLSLSNTKQYLERLGVKRSRTAIHNWVQKAELQPTSEVEPNHIAVDETVIQLTDEQWWLYRSLVSLNQLGPVVGGVKTLIWSIGWFRIPASC